MDQVRGILGSARQFDIEQLRTQIVTWDQPPLVYAGADGPVVVWARDDPVLRLLGKYRDERTFREMRRTELKIKNSIEALSAQLLGFGWDVGWDPQAAASQRKSKGADYLKRFCRAALRPLRGQMHAVLKSAMDMKWDGWCVSQGWWAQSLFSFEGRSYWGIDRLKIRPQELFGVTPDEKLAWLGYTMTNSVPEILADTEEDQMSWHHFTAGGTGPYGEGLMSFLWLHWWVKQRCFEYMPRGARNAIQGIPVLKERFANAPVGSAMREGLMDDSGPNVMRVTVAEAQKMLEFLEEYGILIVRGDLEFENLLNSNFAEGWIKIYYYLDEMMQIAIEGQHLTATMGDRGGGGRALGDVQAQTKLDKVKDVAREVEELPNWYMRKLVEVNLGEVDPDDIPWWGFRILDQVSVEKAKAFTDMGGILDADVVAEDWGLTQPDPDQPPGAVLKAQVPPPMVKTAIDVDKGAGPGARTPTPAPADSDPGDPTRAAA